LLGSTPASDSFVAFTITMNFIEFSVCSIAPLVVPALEDQGMNRANPASRHDCRRAPNAD
jgi:hypothetical protein